jgi:aminopeptidase N
LFIIFDYGTAISVDSSSTTHPIVRKIESPAQMAYTSAIIYQKVFINSFNIRKNTQIYDFVCYKGATVIRMLKFVMTDQKFQTAIQQYLKKYQYLTVETENLFDELNQTFPEV